MSRAGVGCEMGPCRHRPDLLTFGELKLALAVDGAKRKLRRVFWQRVVIGIINQVRNWPKRGAIGGA